MEQARTRSDRSGAARSPSLSLALAGRVLGGLALAIGGVGPAHSADVTQLTELRTSVTPERSRLVFDLGAPTEHTVFTLTDPDRIVIDLEDVEPVAELSVDLAAPSPIIDIRSAVRHHNDLRVVLDLRGPARVRSFSLQPAGPYGHRLVVDVMPPKSRVVAAGGEPSADDLRDIVIVIDPGHGGHDPGATGPRGTHEAEVVLQIARRLRDLIDKMPGFRAVMTRNSDVYLPLRERIRRAREARADMFISIHADAFRDPRADGSSVYALSLSGATSEAARWLAESENSVDLLGGISLDDKDRMVASVLLDLSQTATIEASLRVGEQVLDEIGDVNQLHKERVQQAGFVVLKSPDIPSILVETAFISNPEEARQLLSPNFQWKLAKAIRDGVRQYFERRAPPGTLLYARN